MITGAPSEARWTVAVPRRRLATHILDRIIRTVYPQGRAVESNLLPGGLRNSNFILRLDGVRAPIVLRIYEHDPAICCKEFDLMRMVRSSVPVPEVIHAEQHGFEGVPPFMLMQFIEGISLRELVRSGDRVAIAEAAYSAGEVLARIGCHIFPKPGWISSGPAVTAPLLEGANPAQRFIDLCLECPNVRQRVPRDKRDRIREFVFFRSAELARLGEERRLVHGDFNRGNLLVRRVSGRWSVVGVLDWEFAVSGSPLADLGNFLRFERAAQPLAEPSFSSGYSHAGGGLPNDWRRRARLIDLVALCESLTRDSLPEAVAAELAELVLATVEDRDAVFG
jgi:aminoglycoside phosphotransferase (APT) family kinase protein